MKKRIGTLKGHPIVEGDINLVKYPEIHYDNLKARTFKIQTEFFAKDEEYNIYTAFVGFPTNVFFLSEDILAVAFSDNEYTIPFLPADIIPANTGIMILTTKPEITFIETFENPPCSIPLLIGICVHEEQTAKEILDKFTLASSDRILRYTIIQDEEGNPVVSTQILEDDTIIKKYSIVDVLKNSPE